MQCESKNSIATVRPRRELRLKRLPLWSRSVVMAGAGRAPAAHVAWPRSGPWPTAVAVDAADGADVEAPPASSRCAPAPAAMPAAIATASTAASCPAARRLTRCRMAPAWII